MDEKIFAAVDPAELGVTYVPTVQLRWHAGVLEQCWQGSNGSQRWVPVPSVDAESNQ